ncbi:Transcription initiation factor TFIID subunit 5 [Ptychographa xylographoides]|nr:Transcription initiation factor TFIID subunit 5 [Ptychographa xylographoides]
MEPRLRAQVIEYLSKKGYNRTEAMLRNESATQDAEGRPLGNRAEDGGGSKYGKGFELTRVWIEDNLEIYKPELRRLLWPLFVYSFLGVISEFYIKEGQDFFNAFRKHFEDEHPDDLRALAPIALPEHVENSQIGKIYRNNKYRVRLSSVAFFNLVQHLESKEKFGGSVMMMILQTHLNIVTVERAADDNLSLAKMLGRAKVTEDFPAEDEGIPGHNAGSANTDRHTTSNILTRLKLGPLPMEPELLDDVQAELEEEDVRNPPVEGQHSLVQEFAHIKREESEDAPNRTDIPVPPSKVRDVVMEVQKVKENRDRFRIEGRTGGVGPAVSVVMFTFHNTYDNINCIDISGDNLLIAAGMQDHYIQVWSLKGEALASPFPNVPPEPSRKLIGHSGPVYNVSFSPSIAGLKEPSSGYTKTTSTGPQYLLSGSMDRTVRLWDLELWQCLVVYKGHDGPVWDIQWGPYGHYFLTGSRDRTARLWSQDQIVYLRMFAGHEQDVDCVAFHPNSAYVFTGSSDRNVRMWQVTNGVPVRLFTGHAGNLTALACSPTGKILASADDQGTIILWDLGPGKLLKRMRGHAKGGIWSLSWSAESTVIASCGQDGTVRVWDVAEPSNALGQGKVVGDGVAGTTKIDAGAPTAQSSTAGGTKKKGKDTVVTADQIGAFPTKKSPVYKVKFTRMNLVVASGAYMP